MEFEMEPSKITVPHVVKMKDDGQKIVALTAYDYSMAALLDEAGVDLILVGDSGAMVFAGHDTTLPLTVDEAVYHCKAVRRGVKRALLVGDMPFLSYQVSPEEALTNAGRFFKEAGVDAVKIEGGSPVCATVKRMVEAGMPVMGHLGLTPQSIRRLGGYSVQARSEENARQLAHDAAALEEAGAFSLVLEKIPSPLGEKVSRSLRIPTIGIGAGPHCDGQILVSYDMLGLFERFHPRFVRRYAELAVTVKEACAAYARDVREGGFPSDKESF